MQVKAKDSDNWIVYVHTCKVNNKKYVGITSQKPVERWGKTGNAYTRTQVISKAIKKYGWDNFEHEILESGLTMTEASEKERYYIKKYNSLIPNGYNCAEGGYNYASSEYSRQKNSELKSIPVICIETGEVYKSSHEVEAKLGIKHTNVSKATIDRYRTSGGFHWMKYEEYLKNGYSEVLNPNKKHVICIETQKVYESSRKAFEDTGVDSSYIYRCCAGKTKTAGDLHWQYYEDYINNTYVPKKDKPRGRKVMCIETGKVYKNAPDASRKCNIGVDSIRAVCYGKNQTASGLHWKFVE